MDASQLALHAEMEERHWWFLGRRRILRALLARLLPPGEERLVVDVGCGTGGNAGALADEYRVVAIDTAETAVQLARAKFVGPRFWCGKLADLPPNVDAGAELYLLMDVLEHVPDDFLLLSTVLARCPEGAHVLITVPAHEHLWSGHDEALGHFRRYDAARLEATWQGLPVSVRLLSYFNARLYPVVRAVRWLSRRSRRSFGAMATDLRVPPGPVNRLLAGCLGGESRALVGALEGRRGRAYRTGSSLVAVLRVEREGIVPRAKPSGTAADHPVAEGR
jgi:SAM-dependent methyltransferase